MSFIAFINPSDLARTLTFIGDLASVLISNQSAQEQAESGSRPAALSRDPESVSIQLIARCSRDLQFLASEIGLAPALARLISNRDNAYPRLIVDTLRLNVETWQANWGGDAQLVSPSVRHDQNREPMLPLQLMADLLDLQQTWLHGHSQRVAVAAQQAAAFLGLMPSVQQHCYRAGLIHGIGRAIIATAVWNKTEALGDGDREQIRLVPYWTLRALRGIKGMENEAMTASYVGERLDGSGNFRGCTGREIPIEGQIIAAASAWIALQSFRPWRAAYSEKEAGDILSREAAMGRFHVDVVDALRGIRDETGAMSVNMIIRAAPTDREIEVLRAISQGLTNKEAARLLGISPRTVGAHIESAFRKLGCTTRAQASLKAQTLRII